MDDLKVWIASMSKHDLDASKPLLECLRDGSALCQLINALRPHTVKKINKGSMHTKQVENLSHFLEGAAALGVTELFDAKRAHDLQDEALYGGTVAFAGFPSGTLAVRWSTPAAAASRRSARPTALSSAARRRPSPSGPPGRRGAAGRARPSRPTRATPRRTRLLALFEAKRVPFKHLVHAPTLTSQESVDARLAGGWADATLASGAKAMVLTKAGAFYLLVLPADRKVDWKKVKKAVAKDTRLATEAEVWAATRCLPGAVPPFGSAFPTPMPTHVDASLAGQINFNCGLRTRSVSMPFASFADLERPTVGDFTS
ncbi:hypothetical protein JL721_4 [Aureococcus anophagefferens]|nr:hypothetical protein JL721_4 [Aureococcus anophagefferens]